MNPIYRYLILLFLILFNALLYLELGGEPRANERPPQAGEPPYLVVLGIAQDAGFPQAACRKDCCADVWKNPESRRLVSCLGIVDPQTGQRWMIDATPDFREQLRRLDELFPVEASPGIEGIFLTHAHIGHYTGLMQLGHEVMGAKETKVYSMPRMKTYLETNGPWDQLVRYKNISLQSLEDGKPVQLNENLKIIPFLVPHRDEYSETVGYRIEGPDRSGIFIPDINKWETWSRRVEDVFANADVAYLDGAFYADGEIPGRNMSEIPHPFIAESMARFKDLPDSEKAKIHFIHLNHTNPALDDRGEARKEINKNGFRVAAELEKFGL